MPRDRRATRLCFRYADTRIAVASDAAKPLAWLAEFLVPQFEWESPGPGRMDCLVQLTVDARLHQRLDRVRRSAAGREVDCFTLDGRFARRIVFGQSAGGRWVFDGKHNTYYRVSSAADQIRIVAQVDSPQCRFALMRVVREVATVGQFAGEKLAVHGAAFLAGSRCVLVAGPKRAGKTTFLMWALSRQLPFIANDRLFVDLAAPQPMVRGMPTIVKIRRGSFDYFPEAHAALEAWRPRWHATVAECRGADSGAECVAAVAGQRDRDATPGLSGRQLCEVMGAGARGSAALGVIVFPTIAPRLEGIRLCRLSPAQAAGRLEGALLKPGPFQKVSEVFGGAVAGAVVHPAIESRRCRELAARVAAFECSVGADAYTADLPRAFAWPADLRPLEDAA